MKFSKDSSLSLGYGFVISKYCTFVLIKSRPILPYQGLQRGNGEIINIFKSPPIFVYNLPILEYIVVWMELVKFNNHLAILLHVLHPLLGQVATYPKAFEDNFWMR